MRLCCFDGHRLGLVLGSELADVSEVLGQLPARRWPWRGEDALIASLERLRPLIEAVAADAPRRSLDDVRLEVPVAPTKIIGAPVNYRDHAAEAAADPTTFFAHQLIRIQEIGLFLKANSSIGAPAGRVALRFPARRTDHELELAVVIGKPADEVGRADALDHVAGYMIGLDMTLRGKEERSLRKSIDSYSVLGPWLVTADELGDPGALAMELRVNGKIRQSANTRDLILNVPELIEFASAYYTLQPGDVIMTGTPAGVGPVQPGDVMEAWIERIGEMRVEVGSA